MLKRSGWLARGDDGEHFTVEVELVVVTADEGLKLVNALFAVEEFATAGDVVTQLLAVAEAELLEVDGSPVSSEIVAVEPDVEEPVVVVFGLALGGVEHVAALRVFAFEADLEFEGRMFGEFQDLDVVHRSAGWIGSKPATPTGGHPSPPGILETMKPAPPNYGSVLVGEDSSPGGP